MTTYAEVLASPQRPKIGVVLSSGGIRPLGAIELFQFFEESHIPIDLLVGCSGGGIAASLKGMGLSIKEMREKVGILVNPQAFTNINFRTIAGILNVPFVKFLPEDALLKPDAVKAIFHELYGDKRLEDLLIKTVFQVTSAETGMGLGLEQGLLEKAVYATCALPPFFPPIDLNGKLYMDGGFSTPLPILEAVSRDMDIIIAVDFNSRSHYKSRTIFDYYSQLIHESQLSAVHTQNSLAVHLHHYEIIFIDVAYPDKIAMWDTHLMPLVMERARIAVEQAKERIFDAIEGFPGYLANRKTS